MQWQASAKMLCARESLKEPILVANERRSLFLCYEAENRVNQREGSKNVFVSKIYLQITANREKSSSQCDKAINSVNKLLTGGTSFFGEKVPKTGFLSYCSLFHGLFHFFFVCLFAVLRCFQFFFFFALKLAFFNFFAVN